MDFSLTPEQRAIQALAREFADAEIAPHAAGLGPRAHLPAAGLLEARRARADGRLRARGARRRRRGLPLVHPRARGAVARRCGRRRHRRRAHERRDAPDPRVRHRRAAAAVRARPRRRPRDRRVRAHRARLGLGRRRAAHGGCRRTATAGGSAARSSGSRTAATPARSSSSPARMPPTAGTRGVSAFLVDGSRRRGDARGGEARPQLVLDRRHPPRRCLRRARSAAPRGEPRLHGRDGDARRRPHRHRRAGRRDRPGRLRRRAALRRRAPAVRQPDRRLPGDPVQARRHGDRDRRRPRASSTAPPG